MGSNERATCLHQGNEGTTPCGPPKIRGTLEVRWRRCCIVPLSKGDLRGSFPLRQSDGSLKGTQRRGPSAEGSPGDTPRFVSGHGLSPLPSPHPERGLGTTFREAPLLRKPRFIKRALAALLVGLLLVAPQTALAHASLLRADPSPGAVLEAPPARVTIWFTEPVEPRFSEIQVLDVQGQRVDNSDSAVDRNDPTALSVSLRPVSEGTYTVAWKNTSSVDGHTLQDSYFFTVGEAAPGTPGAGVTRPPVVPSPLEPAVRWLSLVGIAMVLGGLVLEFLVWRPVLAGKEAGETLRRAGDALARRSRYVTWAGLLVFLAASAGHLWHHSAAVSGAVWYEALGRPAPTVLAHTGWGHLWLWRTGLLALAAVCLGVSGRHRRQNGASPGVLDALAVGATVGVLLTLSLVSHAAAAGEIRLAAVSSDFLHLLGASVWIGGLVHLAVGLPVLLKVLPAGERGAALSRMVPRFSTLAMLAVGGLVVTGMYSAWAQVTDLQALATPYGSALLAKIALMVPLLALAAFNLIRVSPRLGKLEGAGQRLRVAVSAEVTLAALVLVAAALLASMEPARQVASREGRGAAEAVTLVQKAEGASIRMIVDPARPGSNLFTLFLTDRLGRAITNASDVSLTLTFLDGDIGESAAPTVDHGDGIWVAHEGILTVAGNWRASVVVRRPDAFDARAAFDFTTVSGATPRPIAVSAATGKMLWGVELAVLGGLFAAVAVARGGRARRRAARWLAAVAVGLLIGALVMGLWLGIGRWL